MKKAFSWKTWTEFPEVLIYGAKEVRLVGETIKVTQTDFIKNTEVRRLPRGTVSREDTELKAEELTEYKSCTGSSQWLTGSTRPDGAADVSLGQVSKPTVEDLKNAMDLIEYLRDTQHEGLTFRPIDPTRLIVVAYGDCSFGNCPDFR